MDIYRFVSAFHDKIKVGSVLRNPQKGESTVMSINNGIITYKRENSNISVPIEVLYQSYSAFSGKKMSTNDLKTYNPEIFDSSARPAGHSCNTTFLFCVLMKMSLVKRIKGKGVSGDPFFVTIY